LHRTSFSFFILISLVLASCIAYPVRADDEPPQYFAPLDVINNFIKSVIDAVASIISQMVVAFFNGIRYAITNFFNAIFSALKGAADWLVNGGQYLRESISYQLSRNPYLGVFFALYIIVSLLIVGYFLTHPQALLTLKGLVA